MGWGDSFVLSEILSTIFNLLTSNSIEILYRLLGDMISSVSAKGFLIYRPETKALHKQYVGI